MSAHDPNETTMKSPFAPGARVAIRQYLIEGGQVTCRELGLGEIARQPRVGDRLEIRIRRERGLASSEVQELEMPEPARLLAVTHGRAYLMSRLDLGAGPQPSAEVLARIAELLRRPPQLPSDDAHVSQYVRIPTELVPDSQHPLVGVPVLLERASRDEPDAKPEAIGEVQLLDEPVPGSPLRFRDAAGFVVTTSVVQRIEEDDDELAIGTANRVYRVRPADRSR